jgi:Methyltransferase domain
MEPKPAPAGYWDNAYALGEDSRSWFQKHPELSLQMLDRSGVSPGDSLIDVGGGASPLAGALVSRGFKDVTVLDLSATGMQYARRRLAEKASQVRWLVADVLTWQPKRRYQAWHDRAVFHFLTSTQAQRQYMASLHAATAASAVAVFGCFAPDGPQSCSGLPVSRYDPPVLAAQLGGEWALIAAEREEHVTPAGAVQPFTWAAFRRQSDCQE